MKALTRPIVFLILVALVLATASPALAKRKKSKGASTQPGEYTDWADEIDLLKIVQTFQLADYKKVAVKDFDTSKTPLPEKEDNTYEPVQEVLADPVDDFMEGLREDLGMPVERGDGGAGVLVVSGVVEQMDPGSRAARYWGGFGAGAVRVTLALEIRDGASGKTLLTLRQERRSGFGVGGGKYANLMNRSLAQIGGDLAMVLKAF